LPTALPDTAVTTPDTPVTLSVLDNDDGAGLAIAALDIPTAGTAVANADGTVTYTPHAGFIGVVSFTYTIVDGEGATTSAAVTITVAVPDRPPVARDDTATVAPGRTITIDAIANDNDPDGDPLRLAALDLPPHGDLSIDDGKLRYRPEEGFTGTDSFAYTVTDDRGGFAAAVVRIAVAAVDQPPVTGLDSVETTVGTPLAIDVLANDRDPEGQALALTALDLPVHGTLAVGPGQRLLYTPDAGFAGVDRLVYTVADPGGATATGEVTIRVEAPDAPPVAVSDAATTEANSAVVIDLLGNDSDPEGGPLTLQALTLPVNGLVEVGADRRITYTPAVGFTGTDSFTYRVADSHGQATSAVVTVTVTPPAAPTTFLNGYAYRRRIVVPRGMAVGTAPLEGFPLMVAVTGDWLKVGAPGGRIESDQGFDLRFEQEDGTRLDHEIERFDPQAGELRAWVRLQRLDPTADTGLFLYYGKPALVASEADPTGVWRDYLAVWHLPDGRDRTGRGRDLRAVGTVATGSLLGDAAELDGTGALVHDSPTWLDGQTALSCQLWIAAAAIGTDRGFLAVGTINGADAGPGLGIRYDLQGFSGGGSNVVTSEWQLSDGRSRLESQSNLQTTAPQQLAMTWAQGGLLRLYADGAPAPTSFLTVAARQGTTRLQGPLQIGAGALDGPTGGWRGLIDEVRFRATALDAGWLATEHANQAAPGAFMGLGGEDAFADADAAPIGLPVAATTTLGMAVDVDVLGAIGATAGSTISAIGAPAHGTATIEGGKVRYTPATAFSGTDRLAYTVTQGAKSADGQISLVVTTESTGSSPAEAKPWDGVLYGCPVQGDTVAPSQIKAGSGIQNFYTFTAERTCQITGVRQIMRACMSTSEVHDSPGDYSSGNGGQITLQIRPLDANGSPSGTILGQTAVNNGFGTLCTNAVSNGFDQYALWNLLAPAQVVKGQRYCFFFKNTGSATDWISMDYTICYANVPIGLDPPQHCGIFYGDQNVCRARYVYGSGPDLRDNMGGMWEVRTADGLDWGNPYYFAKSQARKTAGGAVMVRQKFTVNDYTRVVDGLWFRCWWTGASTTDLIVRLEGADGSLVEQITVPRASMTRTNAYAGSPPALWTKVAFAAARTLTLGKTYYLRFSAAGGGYEFCPQYVYGGATSRNRWPGAYCQYSTNSGSTWQDGWDRSDQPGSYLKSLCLSVAFTVRS
jgi:hypothetical protein